MLADRTAMLGRSFFLGLAGVLAYSTLAGSGKEPEREQAQSVVRLVNAAAPLGGSVGHAVPRPGLAVPVRLYDNVSQTSLFFSETQPHRGGDDGSFTPGPGAGGGVAVTNVEFGMYVNPGPNGEADFDAYCLFYDTLDPQASPVNSDFIAGFFLEVRGVQGVVAYTTGSIDLTPIFPDGILLPDDNWFVDVRFYVPGSTSELSNRATPMFSGSGVVVGSSADVYWRDFNENGQYEPDEARFFGGGLQQANFYLALDGFVGGNPCACDFNDDSMLNSQDFFDFLVAFFGEDPGADFNADGIVNSQDFFDFLTCFFAGCP